jgi:hypothetical protein
VTLVAFDVVGGLMQCIAINPAAVCYNKTLPLFREEDLCFLARCSLCNTVCLRECSSSIFTEDSVLQKYHNYYSKYDINRKFSDVNSAFFLEGKTPNKLFMQA